MNNRSGRAAAQVRRGRPRRTPALCLALLLAGAVGLAAAPQPTPTPPQVTETPVMTTSPTPATSPTPTESPAPGGTPTPDPTATPTPTGTPTPSGTPAGTPTPSAPPTPTGTPTPSGSPSATRQPSEPLDRDADPVAEPLEPHTSLDATLLSALETATARLTTATEQLERAEADYRATKNSLEQARSLAATARERAQEARDVARTSAQQLVLAVRHEAAAAGELGAMFGQGGGTLLQRLGTAERVSKLGADPRRLATKARRDARAADRLADEASAAEQRADGIQLERVQAIRDDAQNAVDEARAALDAAEAGLQDATQSAFTASYATPADGAEWVDPVRGPITDVFGDRPARPAGTGEFHPGVDIGASCGTWMVAAADGVVVQAGPYSGYGNFLRIDHGGGVETAYGHIMDGGIAVQVGEHVSAGQPIARVGSTGMSTGCHLHLEVRVNGNQINPQPFFALRGVVVGG